jgi:acyl-CoA reductase-like NAD-dependent aldehyde dehydrogenase
MTQAPVATVTPGLYIDGEWTTGSGSEVREIRSPYDDSLLATVPDAAPEDVDRAATAAARAFRAPLHPFERYEVLSRASQLIRERAEEFARTIVAEAGKPIRDARVEVGRAVQTILLCAEEAKRIAGEVVPFDATPGSEHRVGMTLSMPVGPVCAITPFNAPLNQLNHKVPTAVAAGCSVVLKPAANTPLSAIRLVETLGEAGLPAGRVNLVLGSGARVGAQLTADPRFAAYSFTGSVETGKQIHAAVGLRKTLLELGNSSANIVHADADIPYAAEKIAKSAYAFAGQLCISAQRVLVHHRVEDEFLGEFVDRVRRLKLGDPAEEDTDVGPMITDSAAEQAQRMIEAAVSDGARVEVGGGRSGRMFEPTVLSNAAPTMTCACEEAFAPVVAVMRYRDLDEACELANATRFGLQAGVFTETIDAAFYLAKRIEVGGVMVNEGSHFRIDQMPFGGVKDSGLGREGVRYAIAEFTEPRLVAFALKDPR